MYCTYCGTKVLRDTVVIRVAGGLGAKSEEEDAEEMFERFIIFLKNGEFSNAQRIAKELYYKYPENSLAKDAKAVGPLYHSGGVVSLDALGIGRSNSPVYFAIVP